MNRFLAVVWVLFLVWGCSQQQSTVSKPGMPAVVGKEVQAQEVEDDASMVMDEQDSGLQTMMEETPEEVTLSVSADVPDREMPDMPEMTDMPNMEDTAEIIGVVSDEPMEEIAEELQEDSDTVVEDAEEMVGQGRDQMEQAIADSLMDEAVEREVAEILGEEEQAIGGSSESMENSWGWSVYDPQAGVAQYYSGDGQLLSEK